MAFFPQLKLRAIIGMSRWDKDAAPDGAGDFCGTETTNMPLLRRSLRAMKPKTEVIVPEYRQMVEI
jgi:hypothetical protein